MAQSNKFRTSRRRLNGKRERLNAANRRFPKHSHKGGIDRDCEECGHSVYCAWHTDGFVNEITEKTK